jgi:hypothetical protein
MEAGNLSLLHHIQTSSEAHPAYYAIGTRVSFPVGKVDHSPPSSAEVQECVELYFHPQYVFKWLVGAKN